MCPSIVLYQPDIAGNTGTILRLAACFGLTVELIEPAGFDSSDRALKRAGMDYAAMATLKRHVDWSAFLADCEQRPGRIVLLTTKATTTYSDFVFQENDRLLFGRESAGVPDDVHARADARLTIPMAAGARSLNLAVSAGIVAAEAMRQGGWLLDA
ncbi:tRNA (cytidine(34)-2'-O)-methyltransferase [Jiella sp. MQZ9-1]|uniref:tRNA (cytidine(34)-2'-O)-methyltransferase n=1 Tax=Jiella flava TaxID=2816857 RepID=A0A939FYN5_9HYPH|nr:tRNA (cytidine(34)-2'-O)-methyltransferase [Jiella flava]MBO0663294.1 tRNA (cytidine(34)-2'-O)-methyltransferase [Jiella flava]MCD2471870.1 tRNA (cytidine(34)-2'-O)-methyltransferase [Jiella flava]